MIKLAVKVFDLFCSLAAFDRQAGSTICEEAEYDFAVTSARKEERRRLLFGIEEYGEPVG